MYCPKVLIGPLGPAPYLIMLKPPLFILVPFRLSEYGSCECGTIDETHDEPNGYEANSSSVRNRGITGIIE